MAKSKHRHKPRTRAARPSGYSKALAGLELANDLIDEGRLLEAQQVLQELHRLYPNRSDVVQNLAYVHYQLHDLSSYLFDCRLLARLEPDEPQHLLVLASAYLINMRPGLALRTYREFIHRWPEHAEADKVRADLANLEPKLQQMLSEFGVAGAASLQLAEQHEEIQVLLNSGRYTEGIALAEAVIAQYPQFAPAYNNLSQLQFLNGQGEAAVATARRVLEFAPDNFQALANLTRMLFLLGQHDEAQRPGERLKALKSDNPDLWLKKAETFSFLGDDQAVLDAYRAAQQSGQLADPEAPALLFHLAGVAEARLGHETAARELLEEALELLPTLELARDNLDDLNKPVGERHGPWAYSLTYWLPRQRVGDLIAQTKHNSKNPKKLAQAIHEYLVQHPDVQRLIPLLLERSDPHAANFALLLADASAMPELLEHVKSFALGQRGSDQLRIHAANLAVKHQLLPAGALSMWTQGAWHEILLIQTEISGEPTEWNVPAKAKRLAEKAHHELRAGKTQSAERLINEALKLAPGDPRLLHSLAQAYKLQGRNTEYQQLWRQVHEQYPDYFFGIIDAAMAHLENHELDQAQTLLTNLLQRRKLHISEMAALCLAQIELALKQGKRELARSSLRILEQVYPEHPSLEALRARVEPPDFSQLFRKPLGWR